MSDDGPWAVPDPAGDPAGRAAAPVPVPSAPVGTGRLGEPRSIGRSILLAVVTLGIYCLYWTYRTHEEIRLRSGQGLGGRTGLVVFFCAGVPTPFLLAGEVRTMLEGDGRESRVSAVTGCWVLLPIAGAVVWFAKVQGQLNDYWRSLGADG